MRRRWLRCMVAIVWREALRFQEQRGRFFAALLRPLLWLLVFGAGFRSLVRIEGRPPYAGAVDYEVYLAPGLCAMVLLFSCMQSALSMVYDRENGAMRLLMTSPFPRWYLLLCKLVAAAVVSLLQVYVFLAVAALFGVRLPVAGYLAAFPALAVSGVLLGAIGLLLSSLIRQLENFAGVMNFVIFPVFFASTALYPLERIREGSLVLANIAALNPFTHAVELVRHSFHLQLNLPSLLVVLATAMVFLTAAIIAFDPARGLLPKKRG